MALGTLAGGSVAGGRQARRRGYRYTRAARPPAGGPRLFVYARVYLRERVLSWRDDREAPWLRVVTVLGFLKRGPLTLRREFCVPESCSSMPESEGGAK